jgi:hypothetical protein
MSGPSAAAHGQASAALVLSSALDARAPTRVSQSDPWDFYQASVRVDVPVLAGPAMSLDLAPDLIPLALTTRNPAYTSVAASACRETCFAAAVTVQRVTRHTTFAFGAAPLAAALHVNRRKVIELILDARAGALWFTRAMPDPDAARLNFTLAGGLGLSIAQRLLLGYAYQHMSNAGLAPINPGVDTHLLYAGVLIAR